MRATATRNTRRRATEHEELECEPVWYLRGVARSAYNQSVRWRRRRDAYRASTPDICGLCGLDASLQDFVVRFQVHHRTYDRLGYELDEDLILLCAPCHNLVHYPESLGAQHWLKFHEDCPELAQLAAELDPFT